MNIIPADISVDFMGARMKAFMLSGVIILCCLVLVATRGLNMGIDFKGGSSIIVAFDAAKTVDRGAMETAVSELVAQELGDETTYVSVQDFDTGVASETDGVPTRRYMINTEVTSLITAERRGELKTAIIARFGEATKVESPTEGSDVFYLTFIEETAVQPQYDTLRTLFAEQGYNEVVISSDVQQQLEVQWLEGLDLIQQEQRAEGAEETEFTASKAAFETKLTKQLETVKDKRFTVSVEELKGKVGAKLTAAFPDSFVAVESATSVSPSVGADLLADGLLAILYAIIGILIYITLRFDFRYAPGAVVALVHDVLFTLGIFSALQVKFSLPIIAALLTIVGYSLNDTIVVLDRVRETFMAHRGVELKALLNRAVNATLSRTVLTSVTTLIVVAAVFVYGGGLIRDFALALLIGIVVGTYSSIFIASPLVYYMDQYITRRDAARLRDDHAAA